MTGLNLPSSQFTDNTTFGEVLYIKRLCHHSERPHPGQRNGATGMLPNLTKANVKSSVGLLFRHICTHCQSNDWKVSLHKNTTLSRNTELVCRSPFQIQVYCDSHCLHTKVKFDHRERGNCAYTLQEYAFSNLVFIIFLVLCHVSDYASKQRHTELFICSPSGSANSKFRQKKKQICMEISVIKTTILHKANKNVWSY